MPGLGESATPPEPWTAEGLAAIVVAGLDIVLPKGVAPHLAGFSFGGVIGGVVAAQLGDRLQGVHRRRLERSGARTLADAAGAGRGPTRRDEAGIRHPSLQPQPADDPRPGQDRRAGAVAAKDQPRPRPHAQPALFALRRAGRGAAASINARLDGIWGERDATAYPHVDERRRLLQQVQPGARFSVVPGAGHWVQFEAADAFNRIITEYATT